MLRHESEIFRIERMESAESHVFQTVEVVVAWGRRQLKYKTVLFDYRLT